MMIRSNNIGSADRFLVKMIRKIRWVINEGLLRLMWFIVIWSSRSIAS